MFSCGTSFEFIHTKSTSQPIFLDFLFFFFSCYGYIFISKYSFPKTWKSLSMMSAFPNGNRTSTPNAPYAPALIKMEAPLDDDVFKINFFLFQIGLTEASVSTC